MASSGVRSKADPNFRGSKLVSIFAIATARRFKSRPKLQGVKTKNGRFLHFLSTRSKADPNFRGSKLLHPVDQRFDARSKADPNFRGSKRCGHGVAHAGGRFKSRPKLQGVKTSSGRNLSIVSGVQKQTQTSGGQNLANGDRTGHLGRFKSRPKLQGVKTEIHATSRQTHWVQKQTQTSGGQNRPLV